MSNQKPRVKHALMTTPAPSNVFMPNYPLCPLCMPGFDETALRVEAHPRGGYGIRDYRRAFWGNWMADDDGRVQFETAEAAERRLHLWAKRANLWVTDRYARAVTV